MVMEGKSYKTNCPEITLKYKTDAEVKKTKITSSRDAYEFFKNVFDADTIEYREEFILLLLNRANNTIGWVKISTGGISGTVVDAKMIFGIAVKSGASGIMLAHNHPSGQLKPSQQDITLTRKIKQGANILELSLLDHIIVSPEGSYYSFADEGQL